MSTIAATGIAQSVVFQVTPAQGSAPIPTSTADRMATEIASYEAIAGLLQINGVSIEEIESRARPGAYATSGFLGPRENFREVLQRDWRTVQALGTTHVELAGLIRRIWDDAFLRRGERSLSYNTFVFSNGTLNGLQREAQNWDTLVRQIIVAIGVILAISSITAAFVFGAVWLFGLVPAIGCIVYTVFWPAVLQAEIIRNRGLQECLFGGSGWNSEITLRNGGLSVKIGAGVINYIEKFGFYQGGGDQNGYRVDPIKLVAVLTGASVAAVESRLRSQSAAQN